jgi:hypothetical protein
MSHPLPRGNPHILEEDVTMDEAPHGASPLLDTSPNSKGPKGIVLTCGAHVGTRIQVAVAVSPIAADRPATV